MQWFNIYNNLMIKFWINFLLIAKVTISIKFDYKASKHEFICFHEQMEKETRFQAIVKANKPNFAIQLFEEDKSIYQDDRDDIFIKQYSAFSRIDGLLLFCLANKDLDEQINYQIQFYHGIHLEGLSSVIDQNAITHYEEIIGQTFEMQNFIKNSYEMNVKTLIDRNQILSSMGIMIAFATFLFFIALALSRIVLVTRLKKMLKNRKMI